MKNLAEIIGWQLIRDKLINMKQLNCNIEQKENNVFIVVTLFKKTHKFRLKDCLWSDLEKVYETCVAAEMLVQGYLLVTIEGGWLVVNPFGEDYQIEDKDCTCGDYLYNRKRQSRCKHLIFRDWHFMYRARIFKYKNEKIDVHRD